MTEELLQKLANMIKDKIRENFKDIHLSQNLMNTISVSKSSNGFLIDIPAEIYDLDRYYSKGVIVYTGKGSYAQSVDIGGGFSGFHKNYVEKAIKESITEWANENDIRMRLEEV